MLANLSNSRYNKNVGSGNTLGVSGMCYFYFLKEVLPLEKLFKLKENGTSVRTEIVAGVTTFMTMAYIIALNPNLLTNFDVGSALWNGVFLATCIASAIAMFSMAFLALLSKLKPWMSSLILSLVRLARSLPWTLIITS